MQRRESQALTAITEVSKELIRAGAELGAAGLKAYGQMLRGINENPDPASQLVAIAEQYAIYEWFVFSFPKFAKETHLDTFALFKPGGGGTGDQLIKKVTDPQAFFPDDKNQQIADDTSKTVTGDGHWHILKRYWAFTVSNVVHIFESRGKANEEAAKAAGLAILAAPASAVALLFGGQAITGPSPIFREYTVQTPSGSITQMLDADLQIIAELKGEIHD